MRSSVTDGLQRRDRFHFADMRTDIVAVVSL
jgi:hypothetical protein